MTFASPSPCRKAENQNKAQPKAQERLATARFGTFHCHPGIVALTGSLHRPLSPRVLTQRSQYAAGWPALGGVFSQLRRAAGVALGGHLANVRRRAGADAREAHAVVFSGWRWSLIAPGGTNAQLGVQADRQVSPTGGTANWRTRPDASPEI